MKTIMVVDDQAIIREPIEAALRRAGYETLSAANGAEALSQMTARRPDLILLDLAMPVMDGLKMLRALRGTNAGKDVPVIVLTALADKGKVLEAAQQGIRGYLLKSRFSLFEMLEQVEETLAGAGTAAKAQASGPEPCGKQHVEHTPIAGSPPQPGASSQHALDPTSSSAIRLSTPSPSTFEEQMEQLRALKPILSRTEVGERVDQCGELKGFSPIVAEVLKLTGNARVSIEHIARAISRDHAIALKILKLANSAVYTRGEPVDSVQTAVLRIGLGQIRQAVLNIAVVERFSNPDAVDCIQPGQFWEHAIATGLIVAEIAHSRDPKEADGAFTMGLLHDVGRMVYADQLGDLYQQVVQTARSLQLPLEQVEQRMLCYNHADMMDRVLRKWSFSKEFVNPVVFHHLSAGNIRSSAPQETLEVATLALANRLAHAFMLGASGNETIYPTEELCELMRLEPEIIARVEEMARAETDKVKFALLANSNQSNWQPLRDVHRGEMQSPLRPLYISASPAIDAHRIFCEQLADWGENEGPNIGVMYLRNGRERTVVCHQYRTAEMAQGAGRLPLIVISPAGKIAPEAPMVADRPWEPLATPFTIPRFIAVTNRLLSAPALAAAA